jgi:hypothetical protein
MKLSEIIDRIMSKDYFILKCQQCGCTDISKKGESKNICGRCIWMFKEGYVWDEKTKQHKKREDL